jgi:hypothetical protein
MGSRHGKSVSPAVASMTFGTPGDGAVAVAETGQTAALPAISLTVSCVGGHAKRIDLPHSAAGTITSKKNCAEFACGLENAPLICEVGAVVDVLRRPGSARESAFQVGRSANATVHSGNACLILYCNFC